MIGPVTLSALSAASAADASFGATEAGTTVGAAAALARVGAAGPPAPQHPASRVTPKANSTTRLRILPLRPMCYQPSQYHTFEYAHKNGRRKNTYAAGYQPMRTLPRPSMPVRMARSSLGTPT